MSGKKPDVQRLEQRISELEDLRARNEQNGLELRKSEEMLQLIIDNIPQRVFWKDSNRVYVGCNKAFAQDVGLDDTSRVVGKTDLDLPFCEQDLELFARSERFVLESGTPLLGHEEQFHKPDGTTAWLRTNVVPLHAGDQKVSGLLTTYEDITKQHTTSQQFVESEQRYRMLFESANDAIFIVDGDYNIIDTNRRACEMFGYGRSQLLSMKTHALQPSDQQARARNRPALFETQAVHSEGQVMSVEVSLSRFSLASHKLYLAIVRDITKHKNALEQLNTREETVRSIINASVEPMLLLDLDGVILNLNQTAAIRFDASENDLIGADSYGLLAPDAAEVRRNYMDMAIRWSMPVRFEETSEGIVFETVIHPVFGSDGMVDRLALFSRDTTEQKRKELRLESDELKYRTVFNRLTSAAVLFDADAGIIREVNDQMERLLGWSGEKITRMHISEIFCAESMQRWQQILARASEEENLHETFLTSLVTASGETIEAVISVRNIWIANKCYLLATIQEKKQLESLLQ